MSITCQREFSITVGGCPSPNPPAFTLPADYDSTNNQTANPFTLDGDNAPIVGGQTVAIRQRVSNGNGIRILDMSTNPGTIIATHNWPEAFVPTYPWTSLYDEDSGLVVSLMHRNGSNFAIGFWDPLTGYVSHIETALLSNGAEDDMAVIPVRGQSHRVLVSARQSLGAVMNFWLIDTLNQSVVANYTIASGTGKPTYCCEAEVGCIFVAGVGPSMFDITTGTLNGVTIELAAYNPVYVDSIERVVCFKGSAPATLHSYNPNTGALETNITPTVAPREYWDSISRPSIYNFYLDRYVVFVDDPFPNDILHIYYYDPSDWSFADVVQDLSAINLTPVTLAFAEDSGNMYTTASNQFFNTRPIV